MWTSVVAGLLLTLGVGARPFITFDEPVTRVCDTRYRNWRSDVVTLFTNRSIDFQLDQLTRRIKRIGVEVGLPDGRCENPFHLVMMPESSSRYLVADWIDHIARRRIDRFSRLVDIKGNSQRDRAAMVAPRQKPFLSQVLR